MTEDPILVDTVADFLRDVAALRQLWKQDRIEELWFRGESARHCRTTLKPTLYRSERPTPNILDLENYLFEEFTRSGATLSESQPEDDADWYFLMQHHGGPTRLLDWSDGALIALHFALTSKSSYNTHDDAVVYALDPIWLVDRLPDPVVPRELEEKEEWDDLDMFLPRLGDHEEVPIPDDPLVLEFERFTRRIVAQQSRFIIFGLNRDPLTSLLSEPNSRLVKIVFDGSRKAQARYDLRTAGVTEAVVYPDLDGLGREIANLWKDFEPTHTALNRRADAKRRHGNWWSRVTKRFKNSGG
jgi:hypothetical protein